MTAALELPRPEAPARLGAPAPARRWLNAAAVVVALLVATPILAVAATVFVPSGGAIGHLIETTLPAILRNTVGLLLLVGAGVVVIGTGTAWLVTAYRFPGARAFTWLLLLPLAMPAYIIGYAYTDALAFAGPVQSALREAFGWSRGDYWFPDIHSLWGVSLMLTLVLYPYVYLLARAAFLDQSVCALEAARVLGRGPLATFVRIGLPLARPAIAAGAALALMEALADFGTVEYFGVQTFTTAIYRTWFGMGDRIAAGQLATALLAFVLLLILVERWYRRGQRFHHTTRRQRPLAPAPLTGWRAALATIACALPVLLGFVVPVLILVRLHLSGGDPFLGPRFLGYAANSFILAALAAIVIVAVALLLAYTLRLTASPAMQAVVRVAALGYAVPGTVIAVGVLVPLGLFDNALDQAMRAAFGVSTGLLLSGTLVAVLFAYLVRFLAVALGAVEAGFAKVSRHMDDVARTLGASEAGVARRVHLPLLRRPLLAAGVIVFVDVLKELPATLIVRPFDFDTLAVRVYQLASDERLAQASTGALVIVAVGVIPVAILTRMMAARPGEARSVSGAG